MKIVGALHLPYERGKLSGKACRAFRFDKGRFSSAQHEVQTTDSTAIEVFLHEKSKRYTVKENRSSSGSSALATSIETAPKTTAFSAARRTSRTIYGKRAAFPAGKHKPARAKKTAGDSECQKENGRKPEESKEAPRPATCRTAVAGNDWKARQSSENGRNDKSRPEGSLPMPQTPPAKDQRVVQGMSEQPQIGTSRPVAPVHAPGERHVGAPPFGKNPFIKLIGRESFRLPHLARTHRHDGQRQAAVPSALEQQDIPVPVIVVRSDRPVFPEHAVADIIGIATGYADAEIDVVQMEVAKEFLVERMFAPDRLGHDQALAVHLNDRRKVGFSSPVFRADHTPTGMPVQTGTHVTLQPSRQRRRPRFERVPEEPDHARSRRSPVKIDDRAGPRVGPERESSCRKHKQSFLAREA